MKYKIIESGYKYEMLHFGPLFITVLLSMGGVVRIFEGYIITFVLNIMV